MNRTTTRARRALAIGSTALGLLAPAAWAQVSAGGSLAIGQLGYDITSSQGHHWKGDARGMTVSGDIGLPNGFYASLSHTGTSGGRVDFSRDGRPGLASDFRRGDTALTLGWSLASSLNTFIGLKKASTDIHNSVDTQFRTSGYFVGLAYPMAIGPTYLNLSGAVGLNRGTWSDTGGPATDSALGYSLGARLSVPIVRMLSASAGLKWQRYAYDLQAVGVGTVTENVRLVDVALVLQF